MIPDARHRIGFVAIGRNEGERLKRCLASLQCEAARIVYVDSGSSDGSADHARGLGAAVVDLDMSAPFTAARARNAGFDRLVADWPDTEAVMFIDGDCELISGFIEAASACLDEDPEIAAVCGRLRERFPEASFYNRLCDAEWAMPVGDILACGGVAMFRRRAFERAGRYDSRLIAGEEPELCVRLRERGGRIVCIDTDMALHDASMTHFSQWRRRAVRTGHAFAEISAMHKTSSKRIWRRETLRAVGWSGLAPASIIAAIFIHPAALLMLLAYVLQILRIAQRERGRWGREALAYALFNMLSKFAEAKGVLEFWFSRARGRPNALKEYKAVQK